VTIEFIYMIHHRCVSEVHPPPNLVLDLGYIRDFAQAAEAGGFDRLRVGYHSDAPAGSPLPPARCDCIRHGEHSKC
jgi:alkanesulfonate monooxygenase